MYKKEQVKQSGIEERSLQKKKWKIQKIPNEDKKSRI
jgi:hypothetical protein